MHRLAAEAILTQARQRCHDGQSCFALNAGQAEALEDCIIELGDQRDRALHEAVTTLAEALKKFAPDLAKQLVERWERALAERDAALEELLSVLGKPAKSIRREREK